MRYLWKICPTDRDYAELHIDSKLPKLTTWGGSLAILNKPIPAEFKSTVDAIMAIPGVESLSMERHRVGITKGRVFRWDEIMPVALGLVRDQFDPDGELVSVTRMPDDLNDRDQVEAWLKKDREPVEPVEFEAEEEDGALA